MERLSISLPIIVEGRYDKSTLMNVADATVVTLGGFSVFNSKEKQALIRRLARDGIIILTDPDGAGKTIRAFLQGIVPKDKIINLYVPRIEGKERRKSSASKEGVLGVEGMSPEVLRKLLEPFADGGRAELKRKMGEDPITKLHFFELGLTGADGARERRAAVARHFELPEDMTANALLDALNVITFREELFSAVRQIFDKH
jgi:ribonuclease M5